MIWPNGLGAEINQELGFSIWRRHGSRFALARGKFSREGNETFEFLYIHQPRWGLLSLWSKLRRWIIPSHVWLSSLPFLVKRARDQYCLWWRWIHGGFRSRGPSHRCRRFIRSAQHGRVLFSLTFTSDCHRGLSILYWEKISDEHSTAVDSSPLTFRRASGK